MYYHIVQAWVIYIYRKNLYKLEKIYLAHCKIKYISFIINENANIYIYLFGHLKSKENEIPKILEKVRSEN